MIKRHWDANFIVFRVIASAAYKIAIIKYIHMSKCCAFGSSCGSRGELNIGRGVRVDDGQLFVNKFQVLLVSET